MRPSSCRFSPSLRHWYSSSRPSATTLKKARSPASTSWLTGCCVISGGDYSLAFIGNAIAVAILAGAVGDVATILDAIVIAIRFAFVWNIIAAAVLAGAVGDVATIGGAVVVTIRFALVRNIIAVAIYAGALGQVTHIADTVWLAVGLIRIEQVAVIAIIENAIPVVVGLLAFVGHAVGVAVSTVPGGEVTDVLDAVVVAVALRLTLVRNFVLVAVLACAINEVATIGDAVVITIRFALVGQGIMVAIRQRLPAELVGTHIHNRRTSNTAVARVRVVHDSLVTVEVKGAEEDSRAVAGVDCR